MTVKNLGGRPKAAPIICRECGHETRHWARGLCCTCYERNRRYGWGNTGGGLPDPTRPAERPTETVPGSQARIAVYAERAASGQHIFHPHDRRSVDGLVGHEKPSERRWFTTEHWIGKCWDRQEDEQFDRGYACRLCFSLQCDQAGGLCPSCRARLEEVGP